MNAPRTLSFYALLELAGLIAFGALFTSTLAGASVQLLASPLGGLWLASALVMGWLAADLGSGLVHWLFDNYFEETTPFFGPNVVFPFREHHSDPENITRHNLREMLGNSALITLPVQLGAFALTELRPVLASFLSAAAIFGVLANLFHSWAHLPRIPAWLYWLQKTRLVLNPAHHEIHHTAPHASHYCVCSGAMNAFLSRIRFWESLEWTIYLAFRVRPRHALPIGDAAAGGLTKETALQAGHESIRTRLA
jgi:Lipid desaturase domain